MAIIPRIMSLPHASVRSDTTGNSVARVCQVMTSLLLIIDHRLANSTM